MTDVMGFPARFRDCLLAVEVASPEVRVYPADSGKYQYYGKLVSTDFEGKNEAYRQRLVWGSILARLNQLDQERVAFVFTDAPSELERYPLFPELSTVPAPAKP